MKPESTIRDRTNKYFAFLVCLALTGAAAGQVPDEVAIDCALVVLEALGQTGLRSEAKIARRTDNALPVPYEYVEVSFGERFVRLRPDTGRLAHYFDLSKPVSNSQGARHFRSEEQAWESLEEIIRRTGSMTGMHRLHFQYQGSTSSLPEQLAMRLGPKPYGYEVSGGNIIAARYDAATGRLRFLAIGSGWTYEAPNIQVTPQQAIEAAIRFAGGVPSDWKTKLEYMTSAAPDASPAILELRARKIMRLCYQVYGREGFVAVDSSTGEVIDSGTTAEGRLPVGELKRRMKQSNPTSPPVPVQTHKGAKLREPNGAVNSLYLGDRLNDSPPLPWYVWLATGTGGGLIIGMCLGLWKRGR